MRVTVHVRGVGGQALPFIVTMLGRRAAAAQVRFASREVFGMAQRGGSVFATLEMGEGAGAERAVLVGLELLEGLRGFAMLRPGEQAIVSTARMIPPGSWRGGPDARAAGYPTVEQVAAVAREAGIDLTLVETTATAPWAVVQAAIDRGAIPLGASLS